MTRMKTLLLFLLSVFIAATLPARGQIVEVPLNDRITQSDFIFEGRVLAKESFWNEEHNNIYTLNYVQVYKIFKGDERPEKVMVVTPGGAVGDKAIFIDHVLKLSPNKVGLFFVKLANGKFNTHEACYDAFAAQQSFIEYDLVDKIAADQFKVYENINRNLYKVIRKKTKKPYIEIKHFDINKKNS